MSKIFIMCGAPGSGKSTFVQQHFDMDDVYIIESDKYTKERLDSMGYRDADHPTETDMNEYEAHKFMTEVWEEIFWELSALMDGNETIVLDATNTNTQNMRKLIKHVERYDYEWLAIAMPTPLEACKANNKKRARQVPNSIIEDLYEEYLETVSMLLNEYPKNLANSTLLEQ